MQRRTICRINVLCARHRLVDAVARQACIAIHDATARFASREKANFDVFDSQNLKHFYLIAARDLKVKRYGKVLKLRWEIFSSRVTV